MKERACFRTFLFNFLALLFMALLSFSQETTSENKKQPSKRKKKQASSSTSSSWDQIKNLLTCKQVDQGSIVHDPSKSISSSNKFVGGSCKSICSFRDVVHRNTSSRVVHRADNSSPESSSLGQETRLLSKKVGRVATAHGSSNNPRSLASSARSSGGGGGATHNYSSSSSSSSTSTGMHFRKLSGCYECHTIVDPRRYPLPRTTICACSECGEVFPKIESLEHHQAIRHAVSELGPEDSSRNIVEIIFKSSWLKKDNPICKIERILKVHNTQKTIQRFEDCREAVKMHANNNNKKSARCAADGNELLRFHCTTLTCSLGGRSSTSLCGSIPGCGVCTIIRHGFHGSKTSGVRTTASSGRAHDCLNSTSSRRAMLVCRVIAGKVRCITDNATAEEDTGLSTGGSYDSVAGYAGIYANLEELNVFNPRAILPCFVVIYKALES